MRYAEFRDAIGRALHQQPDGLTWMQLKQRLHLPYERPCPTWTRRLEDEIGLMRVKGAGRAYVWRVRTGK